jgi:hypothetical protein
MNPPSVPTGGGSAPVAQQIGNLIRHWVHYDNTIATLNREIKKTRELRSNYEAQVLQMLRSNNMSNPVIQIGDGRLIVSEDKYHSPLTFTSLESLLHQYYAKKPGAKDETADIIKFVKSNRDTTLSTCLKRQGAARSRSNDDK